MKWNLPRHPFRITAALCLCGVGAVTGNLGFEIVLMAGALKLLWNL